MEQSGLKVSIFPVLCMLDSWASHVSHAVQATGTEEGLGPCPKIYSSGVPGPVTTVANCGKGLASTTEGGNLAPEGTRVTAELASCREARQGAPRAA